MPSLYLYCVVQEHTPLQLAAIKGLYDAPLKRISTAGLTCIASPTESKEVTFDRASALTHQKVLEQILEHTTMIPIAFGHIVKSESHIKEVLLRQQIAKLKNSLEEIAGTCEIGVKLYWKDIDPVLKNISESHPQIRSLKKRHFISRDDQIYAGEIANTELQESRESLQELLLSYLKEYIIEWKNCDLFGDQMITNLACLTKKEHLESIDKAVNTFHDKHMDDSLAIKYVGPAPPFNFVDIRIPSSASNASRR
jgi:hypothetical protein